MTQTTTPAVTYTNAPLVDVTCQLTFPQNLKISAAPPVGFQEKVKDMFPMFALTQDKTAYNFMSTDQRWQLVLGKGALTLVARQYDGWMNFSKYLQGAMAALEQEYPPQFVLRDRLTISQHHSQIGLRGDGQGMESTASGKMDWRFGMGRDGRRNEGHTQ